MMVEQQTWDLQNFEQITIFYEFFTRYTLMSYYYTYYYNRHIGEHYVRLLRNDTTENTVYNTRITNRSITNQERRVTKTTRTTGKLVNTQV
jgi:hypothetical protein